MIRRAFSQLRRTASPHHHHHHRVVVSSPVPPIPSLLSSGTKPSFLSSFSRSFSDDASTSDPPAVADASTSDPPVRDVSDAEFKRLLENYFQVDEETDFPAVASAVMKRKLSGKHEDADNEFLDELRSRPLPETNDLDFESDFDEYETDEELDNLYNARQYVEKKMINDKFFNMDDKKYDELVRELTADGTLQDTKDCEAILEDMLNYDKLLPDEIKQKVQAKYNELEGMCDRGELQADRAYELFKEFEDKMVAECIQIMDSEKALEDLTEEIGDKGKNDKLAKQRKKKVELDDPPGEGPILRWESRVVFVPGGDAWHPKNRKVKLSVTVKELGLSNYAFRRLRELVGKRYHSGRDELTITSERYEHREENRKDCLRTLYELIQDAVKADKLVEEARTAYVKERLKKNILFMERLKSKVAELKQATA
ncbi:Ribosomal protein S24/S35 [Rhynchospora pubera]|uniref:Ribosomal protein S24/S35 n=1 Tax=Rhynchospora pubera TaxID=906938 RepID=A0AAV8DMS4_9POAL|nr:Ribosomal protein S24/S35 [Rhynchospora pubera]